MLLDEKKINYIQKVGISIGVAISIIFVLRLYFYSEGKGSPSIISSLMDIVVDSPAANTITTITTPLTLVVQPQPTTYNIIGQTITYSYLVANTGTSALQGPVTITDDKIILWSCPEVNTMGNMNDYLDMGESITCTGAYSISQADFNNGSVKNTSTASVGGQSSSPVNIIIQTQPNKVLDLSVSANPPYYNQANQYITYIYSIKNISLVTLGPSQFVIKDSRISPNLINCGSSSTILSMGQSVGCNVAYMITETDLISPFITNDASATGAGANTIQPATVSIINATYLTNGTPFSHAYLPPPSTGATPVAIPVSGHEESIQGAITEVVKQYYEETRSNISYALPDWMKLDETVRVNLVLSNSASEQELLTQVAKRSDYPTSTVEPNKLIPSQSSQLSIGSSNIETTNNMKAKLYSEEEGAFIITELHDNPVQDIRSEEEIHWTWTVNSKKEGTHALTLIIYKQVIMDNKEYYPDVEIFRKNIPVKVTTVQRLTLFDWKWVVGIIITSLLIPLFFRWYDARKKVENIKSPPVRKYRSS